MKIEKTDYNQIKISLSCTEMLQINPEVDPDISQKILIQLFHSLESAQIFSMMNQKIILEIIPSKQDGCDILVTKSEDAITTPLSRCLIFSFPDKKAVDDTILFIRKINNINFDVYQMDEQYYMVFYVKSQSGNDWIDFRLFDLGESVANAELFESVLKEYGIKLDYYKNHTKFLPKPRK